VSPGIRSESLDLKASFEYQACDDRICYAPAKVDFTFSLPVEALERQRPPTNLQTKPAPWE
jgi:hypothetical protein